jgi:hypothetical protein
MAIMAITATSYKSTSPYYGTGYLEGKFLDLLKYRSFPKQADDIYKEIGPTWQYRPDLLSYDLYKTTDYWWVFAVRNKDIIKDPIWDFTAEKSIYIPKLNTILQHLGS